jgi:2-dehydro-3-deoxyphosphogluconate aldolase/(4S)-4-hydroxy-2-oxoglutarate aldolase
MTPQDHPQPHEPDGAGGTGAHRDALHAGLAAHRVVAIIRAADPAAGLEAVNALVEAGVRMLEVSLTSTRALELIEAAASTVGDRALLGAGTAITGANAADAIAAGARFLVTPGLSEAMDVAERHGVGVIAGALTPTEVISAAARASAVKLFPASLGGPTYLKALRAPFPDVPFVPVGGIDQELAGRYLEAGALAVGVGSPLLGDAGSPGADLDALRRRAAAYTALGSADAR